MLIKALTRKLQLVLSGPNWEREHTKHVCVSTSKCSWEVWGEGHSEPLPPSFTMGKCAFMQAVKQPEHGRVLTTEDWNILLTDELRSKFNFVRFRYSIEVMQYFPFLMLLQYIHFLYAYLLRN